MSEFNSRVVRGPLPDPSASVILHRLKCTLDLFWGMQRVFFLLLEPVEGVTWVSAWCGLGSLLEHSAGPRSLQPLPAAEISCSQSGFTKSLILSQKSSLPPEKKKSIENIHD